MDKKFFVLGLLENVLGRGKKDKNDDYVFYCPICLHKKPKLVINIRTGQFNCWTCHPPTKGVNPSKLFKKLSVPKEQIAEMNSYFGKNYTPVDIKEDDLKKVVLPSDFKLLYTNDPTTEEKIALAYLKNRGINTLDIIKYNIGYCANGKYSGRVIIPSYDSNCNINYFVARTIRDTQQRKYDTPMCKKSEIVGFESLINWDVPIILCEGVFDAIAIKRNAVPLFGKTIPNALMKKLVESKVKTIYLVLDKDAIKSSLDYCEKLLGYGKEIYFVDLKEKDPSELGFEKITQLLHTSKPLTFEGLFRIKMNSVFK